VHSRVDERARLIRQDFYAPALHVDRDRVSRSCDDEVGSHDAHFDAACFDEKGRPPFARRHVAFNTTRVEQHADSVRVVARQTHGRLRPHVYR
jgi:hypothetical protein